MLLPLKAIISKKPRKDGNSVIYFQYCFSSTNRVLLNTEIAIPATCWNKKRQCISKSLLPEFGSFETLNEELSRMQKVIETIIENGKQSGTENIGAYVKGLFTPTFTPESLKKAATIIPITKKDANFFYQIDEYIKSKEKKICDKAFANLRSMKDHLLAFQAFRKKPVTFSSLDYNFYTDYVDFLMYDYKLGRTKEPEYGLKVNTIGRTIKQLRVFIKDRVRRKIIPPINMDDFKILDEESDAVYLTNDEIGKIYNADLSAHPNLIEYRDLFVLGCLTGLRFSDYSTLCYDDMRNGMLFKKTNKKDCWVVIPLKTEARVIFERQFKGKQPATSNPVFNRYIKVIAELAGINTPITFSYKKGNIDTVVTKPKSQWVTSHTCRRSFCTNEYIAGTEISLIMKISGHKTHKDFFKYIRITQEEAAHKIQEIWLARNNMQAFGMTGTA